MNDTSERRTTRRDRGAILPLTALVLTTLIIFTSIAVDIGLVRMERRDLQAVADMVALDMARYLDLRTTPTWGLEMTASRDRNNFTASGTESDSIRDLVVTTGCYDGATDTYVLEGSAGCASADVDAVRAVTTDTIDYRFRPGTKATTREAIAERGDVAQAEFLLGSSVAAVSPASSSLMGQILNSVIPGASLIGYEGLVNANVTLADLGAHLPVTVGSPDELLNSTFTINELALASAQAMQANSGNAAGVTALNNLASLPVPPQEVRLRDAMGVEATGGTPAMTSNVNIPQLLTTAVLVADQDHFVTIPQSTLSVPGLPTTANVTFSFTGIEGPRRGGILEGATADTSQVRLDVAPTINLTPSTITQNICSLPVFERDFLANLLGLVGSVVCFLGGTSNQVVTLNITATPTISLQAGSVTASQHIDCVNRVLTISSTPTPLSLLTTVDLVVTATIGGRSVGDLLRIRMPANASSPGSAASTSFAASGTGPTYTAFTPSTARVGANPLGLSNFLNVGGSNTTITVLNSNLSTFASNMATTIATPVNTMLGQIDTQLIQPTAQLLGITLGGADLTPLWMRCEDNAIQLGR